MREQCENVKLLFYNGLGVRACSGAGDGVRGCFGGVRGVFGQRLGLFGVCFGMRKLIVSPEANTFIP